jgi:S1-C subfamily serine protease
MLTPQEVIVPILAVDEDNNVRHFLGTGCFVGPESLLLTADHVIRDWKGPLAITTLQDLNTLHRAVIAIRDSPHDLALLRVSSYRPTRPLAIEFDKPLHSNQSLVNFEYGTTLAAGGTIHFNPATRIGNMTRKIDLTDRLGPAGDGALELSFPALKGASGSPVLTNDSEFRVCGVIVSNVSYHLLPAQIESVIDESNSLTEETRFMLPQAAAVDIRHLKTIYEQCRSNPVA